LLNGPPNPEKEGGKAPKPPNPDGGETALPPGTADLRPDETDAAGVGAGAAAGAGGGTQLESAKRTSPSAFFMRHQPALKGSCGLKSLGWHTTV